MLQRITKANRSKTENQSGKILDEKWGMVRIPISLRHLRETGKQFQGFLQVQKIR